MVRVEKFIFLINFIVGEISIPDDELDHVNFSSLLCDDFMQKHIIIYLV